MNEKLQGLEQAYIKAVEDVDRFYFELQKTLKPCPFCGGPAYLSVFEDEYGDYYNKISCDVCKCSIQFGEFSTQVGAKLSAENIVHRWNKRV